MSLLALVELAAVAGCPKIKRLAAGTPVGRVRNWLWAEGGCCWRERPFISSTRVRAAFAHWPNASCWPLLQAELTQAGSTMHRLGKARLALFEKQGQVRRVRMCSGMASQGNKAGKSLGCCFPCLLSCTFPAHPCTEKTGQPKRKLPQNSIQQGGTTLVPCTS